MAEGLSCAEVQPAVRYLGALASRPPTIPERRELVAGYAKAWKQDRGATGAALSKVGARVERLKAATGAEAAEARSTMAWEEATGAGLLPEQIEGTVKHVLAVRASDADEKLVLTEMDIEGWVHYGSLAREVQGGDVLRLSVGDRLQIYRDVERRFREAERAEQLAWVSMGPFWWELRDRWALASYDEQQAWIRSAPLPPPMKATSLGYLGSILEADPAEHVGVLHEKLGPLHVRIPE